MASFELKGPDGATYEVNAPDAATAVAAFKKMNSAPAAVGDPERDGSANMSGSDMLKHVDSWMRQAANGATFGLADKFAGGMDALTGNASSYDEGVKGQRAQTQAFRESHPNQAMAAEAAGGLGGGIGLLRAGLTTAGRFGAGLLPRVFGYGAEGAAYGAAHGAGNTYSDSGLDYFKNAGKGVAVGGAIGGVLPVAGSIAGGAYRAGSAFLGPRVEGIGRGASSLMRGAAQADEAGLRGLPQLGSEGMLPDAGPAMLGLAQGAATGTGQGRSQLVNALTQRNAETAPRLMSALDQNLGPAPIPSQVESHLSGNRALVSQEYGPVLRGGRAVDTEPLANQLDANAVQLRGPAQQATQRVRQMLDIHGAPGNLDPNPQTLHETRKAIDGLLAGETNPQVIRELTIARQQVDDELTRAVPGIKDVDAQVQELSRQSDGLTRGGQILDSGKQALRPQELANIMSQEAIPAGTMQGPSATPLRIRQGARADIDRRVGTNINDLNQLEKTFATPNDWNYQKLGTVFGEGPRDNMASVITANRRFRDTHQRVVENSQTAQRMESAKAMDGAAGGNVPNDITATSLGLKATNALIKLMSGASNATTKDEIGQLLSARGPDVQRIAQMLLSSAQTTGNNARSISELVSSPRWIAASSPSTGRR